MDDVMNSRAGDVLGKLGRLSFAQDPMANFITPDRLDDNTAALLGLKHIGSLASKVMKTATKPQQGASYTPGAAPFGVSFEQGQTVRDNAVRTTAMQNDQANKSEQLDLQRQEAESQAAYRNMLTRKLAQEPSFEEKEKIQTKSAKTLAKLGFEHTEKMSDAALQSSKELARFNLKLQERNPMVAAQLAKLQADTPSAEEIKFREATAKAGVDETAARALYYKAYASKMEGHDTNYQIKDGVAFDANARNAQEFQDSLTPVSIDNNEVKFDEPLKVQRAAYGATLMTMKNQIYRKYQEEVKTGKTPEAEMMRLANMIKTIDEQMSVGTINLQALPMSEEEQKQARDIYRGFWKTTAPSLQYLPFDQVDIQEYNASQAAASQGVAPLGSAPQSAPAADLFFDLQGNLITPPKAPGVR
jgi:hypothetical protein